MSIEFPGTPEPCLDQSKIGKLIERFEHVEGFRLVRKSDSEVGLVSTTTDESTTETTTITLAPDEIYPGKYTQDFMRQAAMNGNVYLASHKNFYWRAASDANLKSSNLRPQREQ